MATHIPPPMPKILSINTPLHLKYIPQNVNTKERKHSRDIIPEPIHLIQYNRKQNLILQFTKINLITPQSI